MEYARRILPSLFATIRAREWWDSKVVPSLGAFYATALLLGAPIAPMWRTAVTLILAIAAEASFVSVLNDATDREEDARAGKPNRLAGRSRAAIAALIACCAGVGIAVSFLWRNDPYVVALYAAGWISFTLYSAPPVRLKVRGMPGVLADAVGANLCPALVAVLLVSSRAQTSVPVTWVIAVGVWSVAWGVRGIVWHQLVDRDRDALTRTRTFAARHSAAAASAVVHWFAFPVELAAYAAILWRLGHPLLLVAAALYGLLAWARERLLGVPMIVVVARPGCQIVMQEFYEAVFPAAVLVLSAATYPGDWIVLGVHLVLFYNRTWWVIWNIYALYRNVSPARHRQRDRLSRVGATPDR